MTITEAATAAIPVGRPSIPITRRTSNAVPSGGVKVWNSLAGAVSLLALAVILAGFFGEACEPPSGDGHFWWTWWVSLLTGLATFGAVFVALFRENIRARMVDSPIRVRLWDGHGVATPVEHPFMRWHHLSVTNPHRAWFPVRGVRVMLTRVDIRDAQGVYERVWRGIVPFRWAHQEYDSAERTLGGEARADLCYADRGERQDVAGGFLVDVSRAFHLALTHHPRELPHPYTPGQAIRIWLHAQGDEADSPPMRIEISWDGAWEDDDNEMARHFVVQEASRTS
jgi:hypothetical protein